MDSEWHEVCYHFQHVRTHTDNGAVLITEEALMVIASFHHHLLKLCHLQHRTACAASELTGVMAAIGMRVRDLSHGQQEVGVDTKEVAIV